MSKQYGNHDNKNGCAKGHVVGFLIHIFGLFGFIASFVGMTGYKFLGLVEIAAIWAFVLMLISIPVALYGLTLAGIFPKYRSWNTGKYVWYDPAKKERYTTEKYMGPNW